MLAMVLPFNATLQPAGPTNWAQLVVRAQAGDKLAYNQFLRESLPWIEQQARRQVTADMVDDVVQETLLAIHRVLHTFDGARAVQPWLYGIVRFKAKECWRRAKRHQHDVLDDDVPEVLRDGSATADVDKLLSTLPDAQANVVRLTRLKGLSMEEAANATGQSVSWVKVTLHRAIKKLGMAVKRDE